MAKNSFVPAKTVNQSFQNGRANLIARDDISLKSRRAKPLAAVRLALRTRTIWLVLAIGALLRLATLGVQSFWLDEGISFWTVYRSLPDLLELLSDYIRPLFFQVLYPFSLVGNQEWLLRLPSALAGIASLGLLYLLGQKLFDRPTALLATALLALSPLHLWYSQEARFYALVGFLALGAVYFAVRGLKHNRIYDWVLFGIFEGLGLWTEASAVWYILAINLSGLLLMRYLFVERRIFGWALAQVIGVALYLPRLFTFVNTVQGSATSWIPPATVRELLRLMSDFSGGFMHSALFGILSMLLVGFGFALGLIWMLREAPRRWLAYAVLLPWLVVPITISFVVSQPYFRPEFMHAVIGSRPSIFLTRNLFIILFPLLLLLARSLVLLYQRPASTWRWLSLGLAGGLLILYSGGYFGNHLVMRKEDYRSAAQLVAQNVMPGDLVLTSPGYIEQPTAYYYYDREPQRDLSLESVRDGVVDSHQARQDISRLGWVEHDLRGLIHQHERVWLLTNENIHQQPDPDLIAYLEQQAELEHVNRFESMLVRLYVLSESELSEP
jgi:mannosyltransferase